MYCDPLRALNKESGMKRFAFIMVVSIGILSWNAHANAQSMSVSDNTATLLKRPLGEREAVIWYMGENGFVVRTKTRLLILDPFNSGMWMSYRTTGSLSDGTVNPEEIKDQNVIVFVSSMLDYRAGMWDWPKFVTKIKYVFGWDLVSARPPVKYTYMKPREERTIDGVQISTIQATEVGCGFLLKVDGMTMFHGGNHAVFEPNEMADFSKEIDFVAGRAKQCDLVFLEFMTDDGKRSPSITKGIWYAAQKLSPRAIFPMGAYKERGRTKGGFVGFENLIPDLIKEAPTTEIGSKIVQTEKRGRVFLYHDGKIISR
jgi:hypothetical protein